MKHTLAAEAEAELIAGARFYAARATVELGYAFIAEFERAMDLLRLHPQLGALWRGMARRLPLRRFPYSIVYELRPTELRVLALAHQRRKPGYWRGRE